MTTFTTYYLEMHSPDQHNVRALPDTLNIVECEVPQYQLNRFLYHFIGDAWDWGDLDDYNDEQWRARVEDKHLRTWIAYYRGSIAGYYELYQPDDKNTEIKYFGLSQDYIGKGFGGALLSQAITSAWAWHGTKRVWVHTCTLDHPTALNNYLSRGMTVYKEQTQLLT